MVVDINIIGGLYFQMKKDNNSMSVYVTIIINALHLITLTIFTILIYCGEILNMT